jgi:hypothetical protein
MSYISIEDYTQLIVHFDKIFEINKKMPLFYYIEKMDMIIFQIKNCVIKTSKKMQLNYVFLNLYDIVYELKENILDNIKRIDSICKYKIDSSSYYPYKFHNSYDENDYNSDLNYVNRKNYTDMIIEVKKIINIVVKIHRPTEIPYQLTEQYDL